MIDCIIYDQHKTWSPSINRSGDSGRGVGGWECLMVQVAEGIAAAGVGVHAVRRGAYGLENGVRYLDARDNLGPLQCRVLLTVASPISRHGSRQSVSSRPVWTIQAMSLTPTRICAIGPP